MTVYLVFYDNSYEEILEGVFSTREKAESYIKDNLVAGEWDEIIIKEWEMDEGKQ